MRTLAEAPRARANDRRDASSALRDIHKSRQGGECPNTLKQFASSTGLASRSSLADSQRPESVCVCGCVRMRLHVQVRVLMRGVHVRLRVL